MWFCLNAAYILFQLFVHTGEHTGCLMFVLASKTSRKAGHSLKWKVDILFNAYWYASYFEKVSELDAKEPESVVHGDLSQSTVS